jgi:transcriptional regulator with XRE-family HTH domain
MVYLGLMKLRVTKESVMMRVRKVQEVEVPRLSKQLLSARKASDMSLLEICRQLDITPTYWYKLEKGGAETINYDLLEKIEDLLLLDLGIEFPSDLNIDSKYKENGMNLSRLKWIKVVTPPFPKEWKHKWALSPDELKDPELLAGPNEKIIQQNGLTIVPLGFKQKGSEKLESGDLMALTQRGKITHIVEILDEQPYEKGGWFNRYVKIVWWKPEIKDWEELPSRETILGFNIHIFDGIPHEFTAFQSFHEEWDEKGGLEAFREYFENELSKIGQLQPQ